MEESSGVYWYGPGWGWVAVSAVEGPGFVFSPIKLLTRWELRKRLKLKMGILWSGASKGGGSGRCGTAEGTVHVNDMRLLPQLRTLYLRRLDDGLGKLGRARTESSG